MSEKNYWDVKNCPAATRDKFPAYPNHGRDCWHVMDTKKKDSCLFECSFPEKVARGEE